MHKVVEEEEVHWRAKRRGRAEKGQRAEHTLTHTSKLIERGSSQASCIFGTQFAPLFFPLFHAFAYPISLWCIQPAGERDRCIYSSSRSTQQLCEWWRIGERVRKRGETNLLCLGETIPNKFQSKICTLNIFNDLYLL